MRADECLGEGEGVACSCRRYGKGLRGNDLCTSHSGGSSSNFGYLNLICDSQHCTEIIKRLDDVDSGIRVDDQRIKGLNLLADKLISVTGDNDGVIERTRGGLNDRWTNLKGNLEEYRVKLNRALETHKYNRDAEEIEERIQSKLPQLLIQDVGRDLEHVEALIRKQDAVEAQVHAVEQRVKELETERERLVDEVGIDNDVLNKLEGKWLEVSHILLIQTCVDRGTSIQNYKTIYYGAKFNNNNYKQNHFLDVKHSAILMFANEFEFGYSSTVKRMT